MIRLSLLLPSLNVAQYMRECLDSVVHQTLKEIEILCIDAGSTDGTLEIIREYAQKDPRVQLIVSDQRSYGYQMNLGLKQAQGEYIGIVETDDWVPKDMFETLCAVADRERAEFVKADFYRFKTEDGRVIREYNRLDPSDRYYGKVLCPREEPGVFRMIMNTWSGIYSRAFLMDHQIDHNETPGASFQDNGFWFKTFCCAKRAYFMDRPFYMNRRDNAASSVFSSGKVLCMTGEYHYISDWLRQDAARFAAFKGVYALKLYHNLLFTYQRIAPEERQKFARHFSDEMKVLIDAKEYDRKAFTALEWRGVKQICENPQLFHQLREEKFSYPVFMKINRRFSKLAPVVRRVDRLVKKLDMLISWVRFEGPVRAAHRYYWKGWAVKRKGG